MHWDVFNGDADGICALLQLRLADPRPDAMLVTGPKRDIELLDRVPARSGDSVTVCDVSLARNREQALRILGKGANLTYFDHHDPGAIIEHGRLALHISTEGETCTSVIVDEHLDGAYRDWAIVGAFGDNMNALAGRLAEGRGLPLKALRELGNLLNYNGYGASLEDLHFHPDALYALLAPYENPMAFLAEDREVVPKLRARYNDDIAVARRGEVLVDTNTHYAVRLPDGPSSRRISGIFGNRLASTHPDRAHAVLVERGGVNVVSLRAPIASRSGALDVVKGFGGGGREASAGIDALPDDDIDAFLDAFQAAFA